ncbi:MAG: thioredoxin family protein [Bacteroidota bacterium]
MNFSLPNTVNEQMVSLDEYREQKGVVVIFSCNHCPYVVAYEERMKALDRQYTPQGVPFIVISSNDISRYPQDAPEQMKVRARDKNFSFPYLFDETQAVARAFEAEKTPHAYLMKYVDGQWEFIYKGAIDDNWQDAKAVKRTYLSDCIEALLSGGAMPFKETPAVGCTIKWKLQGI